MASGATFLCALYQASTCPLLAVFFVPIREIQGAQAQGQISILRRWNAMLESLNQLENKLHRATYRAFKTSRELARLHSSAGAMGAAIAGAMRSSVQREVTLE